MARVSVIITTYNRPHLLPRAVRSAQRAGRDVEVVVVDDASQDSTAQVCRDLENINYVRVERNLGVAGARNVGLAHAQSPFIAFLDDDDVRLPDSLDLQLDVLEKHDSAGMVCGAVLMGDEECRPHGRVVAPPADCSDLFWHIVGFSYTPLPLTVVVRRECFETVGGFKAELAGIDDWDMWARLTEVYPVVTMQQPVAVYREPSSDSGQGSSNIAAHYGRAAQHQKHLMELPRAKAETKAVRRLVRRRALHYIAAHLFICGADALRRRDYKLAAANVFAGLRANPLYLFRTEFYKGVNKHLLLREQLSREQNV